MRAAASEQLDEGGACWTERVSHRYTRIVIVLSPQVPH